MAVDERLEVRIDVISDPSNLKKFKDELMSFEKEMTGLTERIKQYNAEMEKSGGKKLNAVDSNTLRRAEKSMRAVNKQLAEGISVQDRLNKARIDGTRMMDIYERTQGRLGWSEQQYKENMRRTRESLIKGSRTYRSAADEMRRLQEATFRARTEEDKLAHAHRVLNRAYKAGVFGVEDNRQTFKRYRAEVKRVTAAIKRNESATKKAALATQKWIRTINALKYGTVALAIREVGQAISFVAGRADEVRLLKNRLSELRGDSNTFEAIVQAANAAGADMRTAVAAASRLAVATKDMNLPVEDFAKFNENILKLGILGGATATDLRMATIQLAQGLASATFQGDELRTVLESMPILMDKLAKNLGVARGQMKQLGREGALTPERVVPALLEMTEEVDYLFSKLPFTFQQTMNVLKNSFSLFIEEFDKFTGFGAGIKSMMFDIVDAMESMRGYMKSSPAVSSVGGAIADVWGEQIRYGILQSLEGLNIGDAIMLDKMGTDLGGIFEQAFMGGGSADQVFRDLTVALRNLPATMKLGATVIMDAFINVGDVLWTNLSWIFTERIPHEFEQIVLAMKIGFMELGELLLPGDQFGEELAAAKAAYYKNEEDFAARRIKAEEDLALRQKARAEAVRLARQDIEDSEIKYQRRVAEREEERLKRLEEEEKIREQMRLNEEKQNAEILTKGLADEIKRVQELTAAYLEGEDAVNRVTDEHEAMDRILKLRLNPNQEEARQQVRDYIVELNEEKRALAEVKKALTEYNSILRQLDSMDVDLFDQFAQQEKRIRDLSPADELAQRLEQLGRLQQDQLVQQLGLSLETFDQYWGARYDMLATALDEEFIKEKEYAELKRQLDEEYQQEKLERTNTINAGMALGFQELIDNFNKANQTFGKDIAGTILTAQEEIVNGFRDMAFGAKSASEFIEDLAKSIISDLLRAMTRWAVQQVTAAAMQAAGIATLTATATEAGLTLAGAWAPAAYSASVATLGGAAITGASAYATGMATSSALALGTAAAGMAGQAHEGLEKVPREGTYLLDKGERVVAPEQNRDLTKFLERANLATGEMTDSMAAMMAEGRTLYSSLSDAMSRPADQPVEKNLYVTPTVTTPEATVNVTTPTPEQIVTQNIMKEREVVPAVPDVTVQPPRPSDVTVRMNAPEQRTILEEKLLRIQAGEPTYITPPTQEAEQRIVKEERVVKEEPLYRADREPMGKPSDYEYPEMPKFLESTSDAPPSFMERMPKEEKDSLRSIKELLEDKGQVQGQFHSGMEDVPREGSYMLNQGERVLAPEQNRDLKEFMEKNKDNPRSNVKVQVFNYSAAEPEVEVQQQPDGTDLITLVINAAARDIATDGTLARTIRSKYGLNQTTSRR